MILAEPDATATVVVAPGTGRPGPFGAGNAARDMHRVSNVFKTPKKGTRERPAFLGRGEIRCWLKCDSFISAASERHGGPGCFVVDVFTCQRPFDSGGILAATVGCAGIDIITSSFDNWFAIVSASAPPCCRFVKHLVYMHSAPLAS